MQRLLWEHLLGGWRIVKTMGQKITKLKPFEGFCAESAGALTLFGATHFGIPVSTTHVITGAIIGAGARKGVSAVKWGVTTNIFWAWILTIPVSAIVGSLCFFFSTVSYNINKINSGLFHRFNHQKDLIFIQR